MGLELEAPQLLTESYTAQKLQLGTSWVYPVGVLHRYMFIISQLWLTSYWTMNKCQYQVSSCAISSTYTLVALISSEPGLPLSGNDKKHSCSFPEQFWNMSHKSLLKNCHETQLLYLHRSHRLLFQDNELSQTTEFQIQYSPTNSNLEREPKLSGFHINVSLS